MAENVSPTVGYKDEFWLYDDATTGLYKLVGLLEFDVPTGGTREQEEVTDLDADDWRREYISTFYQDQDIELALNYRPLSDTDVLLTDARETDDVRAFMAVLAVQGVPTAQVTGTARVTGYGPDRVAIGARKTATATLRIVSVDAIEAYVEPGP